MQKTAEEDNRGKQWWLWCKREWSLAMDLIGDQSDAEQIRSDAIGPNLPSQ